MRFTPSDDVANLRLGAVATAFLDDPSDENAQRVLDAAPMSREEEDSLAVISLLLEVARQGGDVGDHLFTVEAMEKSRAVLDRSSRLFAHDGASAGSSSQAIASPLKAEDCADRCYPDAKWYAWQAFDTLLGPLAGRVKSRFGACFKSLAAADVITVKDQVIKNLDEEDAGALDLVKIAYTYIDGTIADCTSNPSITASAALKRLSYVGTAAFMAADALTYVTECRTAQIEQCCGLDRLVSEVQSQGGKCCRGVPPSGALSLLAADRAAEKACDMRASCLDMGVMIACRVPAEYSCDGPQDAACSEDESGIRPCERSRVDDNYYLSDTANDCRAGLSCRVPNGGVAQCMCTEFTRSVMTDVESGTVAYCDAASVGSSACGGDGSVHECQLVDGCPAWTKVENCAYSCHWGTGGRHECCGGDHENPCFTPHSTGNDVCMAGLVAQNSTGPEVYSCRSPSTGCDRNGDGAGDQTCDDGFCAKTPYYDGLMLVNASRCETGGMRQCENDRLAPEIRYWTCPADAECVTIGYVANYGYEADGKGGCLEPGESVCRVVANPEGFDHDRICGSNQRCTHYQVAEGVQYWRTECTSL